MQATGFHGSNSVTKNVSKVQDDLQSLQNSYNSVLGIISNNESILQHVANHITNTQINSTYDGRNNFIPRSYQ